MRLFGSHHYATLLLVTVDRNLSCLYVFCNKILYLIPRGYSIWKNDEGRRIIIRSFRRHKMRVNRKLFLVFAIVFSVALVGGGVFSTQANAACGLNPCGWHLNLSFLNPCNWHFPTCSCEHVTGQHMNKPLANHNGAAQPFPNY